MFIGTNNNNDAICLLMTVCLFCKLNIYRCAKLINTHR